MNDRAIGERDPQTVNVGDRGGISGSGEECGEVRFRSAQMRHERCAGRNRKVFKPVAQRKRQPIFLCDLRQRRPCRCPVQHRKNRQKAVARRQRLQDRAVDLNIRAEQAAAVGFKTKDALRSRRNGFIHGGDDEGRANLGSERPALKRRFDAGV